MNEIKGLNKWINMFKYGMFMNRKAHYCYNANSFQFDL